jgi:DNA polymerase-3 subunit delta
VNVEELREELRADKLSAAYLIVGEEVLLRDDAVSAIRQAVLSEGARDFDEERLDGESTTASALLDSVRTLPVLGRRRLVALREPDAGRAKTRGLTDAVAEAVAGVQKHDDSVLIVVAGKVDGRARWVKSFGKAVIRCDPPRGVGPLSAFIRSEAQRQEIALDAGAVALLAERTGPQLMMLRQEIAKAGLFAGPGQKVTAEHIAESTRDVADGPVWDLTDAIGEGRSDEALVLLGKLLRSGGAPPAILGALANHFRKLTRVQAGGSVPGPPFAVRKLESQARRFSSGRLLSCLGAVHQTDLALKGAGGILPEIALERLVIGLSA